MLVALGVVEEAVEAEAGIDLAERLLLQIGQRDRTASQRRPNQHRRVVLDKMLDHLQPPRRKAGVITVLPREPGVEIDATFDG